MKKETARLILHLNSSYDRDSIKKQYRKLSKIYHPDTGDDPARFKIIKEAYDVLYSTASSNRAKDSSNKKNINLFIKLLFGMKMRILFI